MTKNERKAFFLEAEARSHRVHEASLQKQIRFWQEEYQNLEKRFDFALGIRKNTRVKELSVKPRSGRVSESVAVAVLSDWHAEEKIEPGTINKLNEHNLEICDRKIRNLFDGIIRLTEIQRNGTDIDVLVLALLGDFINGYIHDELVEGNFLSPTQATEWVQERLLGGIKLLEQKGGFKRIIIPTAYGNHGRTTQKSRIATGYKNSYEWLMYRNMRRVTSPMVEWQISDGIHNYVEIFGRVFRFHHGDSIRFQGGVGGITIPVNKAIAQWDKSRRADMDIFGHYHQYKVDRKFICNGSLVGYSPFALSVKAEFEPPIQAFMLVEKQRGPTCQWPIYVL